MLLLPPGTIITIAISPEDNEFDSKVSKLLSTFHAIHDYFSIRFATYE